MAVVVLAKYSDAYRVEKVEGGVLTISGSNSDVDATVNATIDVTAEALDGTQVHDTFMVTPYVVYRADSTDSQAMLLGAELKQLIQTSSDVSMRFEPGRRSQPSNQVGFTAELRF